MKFKLTSIAGEDIEGTFRVSSVSREFDGPDRGGAIVRLWRCPTERKTPEDAEVLELILEKHEYELLAGKFK